MTDKQKILLLILAAAATLCIGGVTIIQHERFNARLTELNQVLDDIPTGVTKTSNGSPETANALSVSDVLSCSRKAFVQKIPPTPQEPSLPEREFLSDMPPNVELWTEAWTLVSHNNHLYIARYAIVYRSLAAFHKALPGTKAARIITRKDGVAVSCTDIAAIDDNDTSLTYLSRELTPVVELLK